MSSTILDWSKIKTREDVLNLDEHLLYDEAEFVSTSDMLKLNPNLTEEEAEDAVFWADKTKGLLLITGEPGNGKGILMHMIAKKMAYYFGKLPVLDTRPRKIFGSYVPFSEEMLSEQVERLKEMESGVARPYIVKGLTELDFPDDLEAFQAYKKLSAQEKYTELVLKGKVPPEAKLQEYDKRKDTFTATVNYKPHVTDDGKWMTSRGEIFLRNSVINMDEFGNKYMGRLSSPTLGIKQVLLKLFNFWRHLHCLMVGVGVSLEDFDRKSLDKATWEAKCKKLDNDTAWFSFNNKKGTGVCISDEGYSRYDCPHMDDCPKFDECSQEIFIGVYMTAIKYNPITDELEKVGDTIRLKIAASEPKHMLGGARYIDIYNSDNAQGFDTPMSMKRRQ